MDARPSQGELQHYYRSLVPIYIPEWWEALWELSVCPRIESDSPDQGPVSWKPWNLFGSVKPFSVHLYLKAAKCIGLKLEPREENLCLDKVARSDFWVTIPFNFERLEQHHYQSNRKWNVSGVLEKDESFKRSTLHQDLSYHSNEMTPCPILHKTE